MFDEVYAGLDDIDFNDPDNELLIFERWDAALIEAGPIVDQELDDIGALEPPVEDEEFIETLLADQAAAFAEFTRLMNAAADGDRVGPRRARDRRGSVRRHRPAGPRVRPDRVRRVRLTAA